LGYPVVPEVKYRSEMSLFPEAAAPVGRANEGEAAANPFEKLSQPVRSGPIETRVFTVGDSFIAASTRVWRAGSSIVTIILMPAALFRYTMSFSINRWVAGTAIAPSLWRARRKYQNS